MRAFGVAILAIVAAGCAAEPVTAPRHPTNRVTPGGIAVWVPDWLEHDPGLAQALADIDGARVPAGWSVILERPRFRTPDGREANGACFFSSREIYVGAQWVETWYSRPSPREWWLHVLDHEAGHASTGDKCFCHGDACADDGDVYPCPPRP